MTRLDRIEIGRQPRTAVRFDSLLNGVLACVCALLLRTHGMLCVD
jgi:hypothetical protein